MKILLINYHCRNKTTHYRPGFFSRALAKRGHDVTVMCTSDSRRWGFDERVEDGVRYVETPDLLSGRLRTGWDPWNLLNRIRLLRPRAFDLVHAFETRPATIHPVLAYLRTHPAPLVIDWVDWWGRGGLIQEHRPAWYPLLCGWFETFYEEHFRIRADGTTVISRALGERARSLGVNPATIHWIPSGAPVDQFPCIDAHRNRRTYGLPEDAFIVADSARDVMLGVDRAFGAVREAARLRPRVFFMMTGDHRDAMTDQARRAGIEDRFRHFGRVRYEELPGLLSCADAFIMPYPDCVANRGRWPGRIGMFLSLGRPVISNPVGEMTWLLQEEQVGLAAGSDRADLAARIVELMDHPELAARLGANARRTAETLSWESVVDRLENCYRKTCEQWAQRR
jgi:glycosyltransferase involved in cell wall biosynthesis